MNAKTQTPAPEPVVRKFPDLHHVALELWAHAADSLDTGDLRWIARILEHAGYVTRNLSAVVDGIGCYVSQDKEVGCFQEPGDVAALLFFITESLNGIQAMIEIGNSAASRIIDPDIYLRPEEAKSNE